MDTNVWWAIAGTALLAVAAKVSDGHEALIYVVTYLAIKARLDSVAKPAAPQDGQT